MTVLKVQFIKDNYFLLKSNKNVHKSIQASLTDIYFRSIKDITFLFYTILYY